MSRHYRDIEIMQHSVVPIRVEVEFTIDKYGVDLIAIRGPSGVCMMNELRKPAYMRSPRLCALYVGPIYSRKWALIWSGVTPIDDIWVEIDEAVIEGQYDHAFEYDLSWALP